MGSGENTRASHFLKPVHSFDHYRFTQSAPPVLRGSTHHNCHGTTRIIVVEDCTESSNIVIWSNCHNIQPGRGGIKVLIAGFDSYSYYGQL